MCVCPALRDRIDRLVRGRADSRRIAKAKAAGNPRTTNQQSSTLPCPCPCPYPCPQSVRTEVTHRCDSSCATLCCASHTAEVCGAGGAVVWCIVVAVALDKKGDGGTSPYTFDDLASGGGYIGQEWAVELIKPSIGTIPQPPTTFTHPAFICAPSSCPPCPLTFLVNPLSAC